MNRDRWAAALLLDYEGTVTPGVRRVVMAIAANASDGRLAVSHARLAAKSDLTLSSTHKIVMRLVDVGWLDRLTMGNGPGRPSIYRLRMPADHAAKVAQ